MASSKLPVATIRRLPKYLKALNTLKLQGQDYVRSWAISEKIDIAASTVRRDIGLLGKTGTRGWGYDVDPLIKKIESTIGKELMAKAAILGLGNMGKALVKYNSRENHAAKIVAAFEVDENLIGRKFNDIPVFDFSRMEEIFREKKISIVILAVPKEIAQETFEKCIKAGGRGFVNFTSQKLSFNGSKVAVRDVDVEFLVNELMYDLKKQSR